MKTTTIIVVLLLLSGCAFHSIQGNQSILNDDVLSTIKVGVTTKAEVLAFLGPPDGPKGFELLSTFEYKWSDTATPPLCYVPLLDLTAKQTIEAKKVAISFDRNLIVSDIQVESGSGQKMYAAGTVGLLLLGFGAMASAGNTSYAPSYSHGRWWPGQAVVNTTPTAGGGYTSTIKYYGWK